MDSTGPQFLSPSTLPEPPGYSHVVSVRPARVVWVSGQVAINADGSTAPPGDWDAQTRLAFANVGRALDAAGAGWSDVVKLTFFVVDVSALATIRTVRDEFVDTERPPASSLVQVAALFRPDLLIEIEAVACPSG
jgi:enamine deaminase RidA (YjgF/YER057c/UK114 family)